MNLITMKSGGGIKIIGSNDQDNDSVLQENLDKSKGSMQDPGSDEINGQQRSLLDNSRPQENQSALFISPDKLALLPDNQSFIGSDENSKPQSNR